MNNVLCDKVNSIMATSSKWHQISGQLGKNQKISRGSLFNIIYIYINEILKHFQQNLISQNDFLS